MKRGKMADLLKRWHRERKKERKKGKKDKLTRIGRPSSSGSAEHWHFLPYTSASESAAINWSYTKQPWKYKTVTVYISKGTEKSDWCNTIFQFSGFVFFHFIRRVSKESTLFDKLNWWHSKFEFNERIWYSKYLVLRSKYACSKVKNLQELCSLVRTLVIANKF